MSQISPWLGLAGCPKADGVSGRGERRAGSLARDWPDFARYRRAIGRVPFVERIASTAASKSSGSASAICRTAAPSIRSTRTAVRVSGRLRLGISLGCLSGFHHARPICRWLSAWQRRPHGWQQSGGAVAGHSMNRRILAVNPLTGQRYTPRPGVYAIIDAGDGLLATFQEEPRPELQLAGRRHRSGRKPAGRACPRGDGGNRLRDPWAAPARHVPPVHLHAGI